MLASSLAIEMTRPSRWLATSTWCSTESTLRTPSAVAIFTECAGSAGVAADRLTEGVVLIGAASACEEGGMGASPHAAAASATTLAKNRMPHLVMFGPFLQSITATKPIVFAKTTGLDREPKRSRLDTIRCRTSRPARESVLGRPCRRGRGVRDYRTPLALENTARLPRLLSARRFALCFRKKLLSGMR